MKKVLFVLAIALVFGAQDEHGADTVKQHRAREQ